MTGWLAAFLIKSTLLCLAFLALGAWRRLSAGERHALTLTPLLCLPLIVAAPLLDWRLPMPVQWPNTTLIAGSPSAPAGSAAPSSAAPAATTAASSGTSGNRSRHAPPGSPSGPSLAWIYGLVVGALMLRAAASWWHIGRRVRRLGMFGAPPAGITLPPRVTLRRSMDHSPWTWGMLRPVIVVPDDFLHWPLDKQKAALDHELAHVYRNDCLSQTLAHLLAVLFWFQPLVWILHRRLGRLAERAADDHVLARGSPAPDYAQWLIDMARCRPLTRAGGIAMSRHPLSRRIEAALDPTLRRKPMNMRRLSILAAVAIICTLPLAAATTAPDLPDERSYLPIVKPAPEYPPQAREQGLEGHVVVEFDVTDRGATSNVRVVEEAPPGVFSSAAADAAARFLYLPARRGGRNVTVSGVRNRITFALDRDGAGDAADLVSIDWEAAETSLKSQLTGNDELDRTLLERAASAAGAERRRHQRLLGDVIAHAEAEAQRTGRGDTYLEAARLASALRETDHAVHCLLRASELILDDPTALREEFATLLMSIGRLDEAHALFAIHAADGTSSRQWLDHLEQEKHRREAVYDTLTRRLLAIVTP